MKRSTILFLVFVVFVFSLLPSERIRADSEADKLQKSLSALKEKQAQIEQESKKITVEINRIKSDQAELEKEVQYLDLQLNELDADIQEIEADINVTEQKAEEAASQLDEAISRVEERDKLLKSRVRAMYEMGDISLLSVLLESDSIGDFLSRSYLVTKIIDSDVNILEQNKKDKDQITQLKEEIDQYLASLKAQYESLNAEKENQTNLFKQKTVAIASLESMQVDFEEKQEEAGEILRSIANEIVRTQKELSKLSYDGGELLWPLPNYYRISSPFGPRIHPITKKKSYHNGLDIPAPSGTKILAAEDGEVIVTQYISGYGNTVMIYHGDGLVTRYSHIQNGGILVKVGQTVKRGEAIAKVGSTGLSTGPHLDFGVLYNEKYVDPLKYVKNKP